MNRHALIASSVPSERQLVSDTPPSEPHPSLLDELDRQPRPDDPSADHVDAGASRREEDLQDTSDQRRAERHPWVAELTITIDDTGTDPRNLHVTSRDISRGGFSFMYRQFIAPGTAVGVRINKLPERGILRGIVRSCVHLGGILHRIGVQFMSEA